MTARALGWFGIVRLGLVQSAIGSIVMLATSLLNRVMVVEYALPAALPAGLVAWHYAVQLSRPVWGHGSDRGRRRTPWIIGGMALLAGGAMLAVQAVALLSDSAWLGYATAIFAFSMIGAGVGAAGTSLLALLATRVAPERRAAAASITWIMMIAGIVVSAGVAGKLVDPFSFARLVAVVGGVAGVAFLISTLAIWGVEGKAVVIAEPRETPAVGFGGALSELWADMDARRFTIFVFLSMLAYSMQDLILEPFTGLRFGMTPGQSTQISSVQHGGVLLGMILVGIGGSAFSKRGTAAGRASGLQRWIVGGCVGSALALTGLAMAARFGPGWPIIGNIFMLGFANGVFAVAAIGTMMALAGAGGPNREGIRMGVWGAAQAIAFGTGGLTGAVAVDAGRALTGNLPETFMLVFGAEALLFLVAAALCLRAAPSRATLVGREVTI
ncbi:BCD family MFS transporter [Sphingomonas psychrolutea]|uniref:Bacteriochlorophyll synthase n=1 Tax=Sphingomonas psychrolutea TaxID=1259676 RepID=A0ABQ1GL52_9SPHN|nr:BCD family MFS transporter [Sphingomonas psychrolutea]GGA46028.1 bacteriochlorophyll synthase [Sphingomonas psychrolutea]